MDSNGNGIIRFKLPLSDDDPWGVSAGWCSGCLIVMLCIRGLEFKGRATLTLTIPCATDSVLKPTSPMMQETPAKKPENLFFRLVIVAGVVFTVTVLAMVVTAIKPTGSPIQKFVDAHAMKMIVVEVAVTLLLGFLALAVDRRRQLTELTEDAAATSADQPTETTDV